MTKPIFCLMGPTASGKTAIACQLVQRFPFEIISVDSALVYRHMNVGTAKPSDEELLEAPHHLLDIIEPTDSYSAAQFCQDVEALFTEIAARNNVPLLVGGTMMYFKALQEGLSHLPEADESIRKALIDEAEQYGWPRMHAKLAHIDPATAARIHPHDAQRIQRALEVYELTHRPLSEWLSKTTRKPTHQFVNLILMPENRTWLHARIEARFGAMVQNGLLEEVADLLKRYPLTPSHPAMRSVGYRQAMEHLDGLIDYRTFLDKGVAATRQLAKRQMTWLRHWPQAQVFAAEDTNLLKEIMAIIDKILDNKQH